MASKVVFRILLVLDLILSGALGWAMYSTQLLAPQLVIMAAGLLILLPLLLALMQREKKGENKKKGLRAALIVVLLFLALLEGAAFYFLHGYNRTMDRMTDGSTQVTRMTVFLKEDDLAQTMEYALEREYVFGTLSYSDQEAVTHTRDRIESKYGHRVTLKTYNSLLDLIRALDEGEVNALLISSAYLDLIGSLPEEYAGYATTLRVLMESEVTTEIARPETQQNTDIDEETAKTLRSPELWENSFVVYVSGIDSYGAVTTSARSDVNILAVVNKDTKTVLLISTPRDFYVPFPFVGGNLDKLTHAGVYGVDCSIETLESYYGLPIDYYLRVNFTGFIRMIDTLGGVDVDSDADFINGDFHFQKGINHLDGRTALRFVRDRYSFGEEGDRARGRHQMAVIKGVIKGLASYKMLTNYSEIMDELSDSFQTNASKALVGELVRMTLDTESGKWRVLTYSVNGYDRTDYSYALGCNAYVMAPEPSTVDYARKLVIAVASGETPTQSEVSSYSVGK